MVLEGAALCAANVSVEAMVPEETHVVFGVEGWLLVMMMAIFIAAALRWLTHSRWG